MRLSRSVLPLVVGILLTVAGVLFGGALFGTARELADRLDAMGALGRVLYVAGYALVTLAFVPGWIPTLAAGAVFPYAEACVVSFTGATIGSVLAFYASRWFSRREVERRIASSPKLRALDEALAENGTWTVFLLRLSPLLPFNLLNYVLGATRVRISQFLVGGLGKIPGAMLYVGVGRTIGDLTDVSLGRRSRTPLEWALLGLGVVSTLVVTWILSRASSRALARQVANSAGAPPESA